jgi:hypothetical protein
MVVGMSYACFLAAFRSAFARFFDSATAAKYKKGREYKAYLAAVAESKKRAKAERKAAKKQA